MTKSCTLGAFEWRPPFEETEQSRMNAKMILTVAAAIVACVLAFSPASAQPAPAPDQPAAGAPAAPDAAAPGAAPGAAAASAETENPYGFVALVKNGDFVSHGVLAVLAIMSLGTWYIF